MDASSRMNSPPVTLINVFTVDPANQDELVDVLARATDASVRHAPGFMSATLPPRSRMARKSLCTRGGTAARRTRLCVRTLLRDLIWSGHWP
jgi:hypothetical protein